MGWLSGRIGSRATLRAVREERASRTRVDYIAALGAFRNAALLLVASATELPLDQPAPLARMSHIPDRWLGRFVSFVLSDRERAALSKHPILLRLSRETPLGNMTIGITQSAAYEESLVRRYDLFLAAASRVSALAPDEDLDLLARIERFALNCITQPTAQDRAFETWNPLDKELQELAAKRRATD